MNINKLILILGTVPWLTFPINSLAKSWEPTYDKEFFPENEAAKQGLKNILLDVTLSRPEFLI